LYDPNRTRARTVEDDMVQLAATFVIESEGEIGSGFKIIPSDAVAWITLGVDG